MVLHGGGSLRIQWPVFPYRLILIAGSFVIKHFSYIQVGYFKIRLDF